MKTDDSLTLKGAPILEADTLVIESTFGLKEHVFTPREEVYDQIAKWVKTNHEAGRNIILGGYAFGKAQELTKVVTQECGLPVITHRDVHRVNQIYENNGSKLGDFIDSGSEEGQEVMRDPFVAVMPKHRVKEKFLFAMEQQFGRKVVAGIATGWAKIYPGSKNRIDRAFQLSDHADYNSLMDYVEQSNPRKVFTIHGYADEFARQLKRKGFNARPLRDAKQTGLDSFLKE